MQHRRAVREFRAHPCTHAGRGDGNKLSAASNPGHKLDARMTPEIGSCDSCHCPPQAPLFFEDRRIELSLVTLGKCGPRNRRTILRSITQLYTAGERPMPALCKQTRRNGSDLQTRHEFRLVSRFCPRLHFFEWPGKSGKRALNAAVELSI